MVPYTTIGWFLGTFTGNLLSRSAQGFVDGIASQSRVQGSRFKGVGSNTRTPGII